MWMWRYRWIWGVLGAVMLTVQPAEWSAWASLEPGRHFQASGQKANQYISDGVVVGGDSAIQSVRVQDIRRAANARFERIVIDLQASRRDGEVTALARPPHYQVSINPEERRLIFTIWGNPQLDFVAPKVVAELTKSKTIESVELLPRVHPDRWTFALNLRAGRPVEVFDLTDPARIIADIRLDGALPK